MTLGDTIGLVGVLVGLIGIFNQQIIEIGVRLIQKRFPSDRGISGYWKTLWTKHNNRTQSELLFLQKTGSKVMGQVVFSLDKNSRYKVMSSIQEEGVVFGEWTNLNGGYRGTLHFSLSEAGDSAQGYWTGISSRDKRVNSGIWNMKKIHSIQPQLKLDFNFSQFRNSIREVIDLHEERYLRKGSEYYETVISNKDFSLVLQLVKGVFDPTLGKISPQILKYISNITADDVLDLGCGSGYLGIFFALSKGSRVVLVDSETKAVHCAKQNIIRNNVEDRVSIIEGNLFDPIYRDSPYESQFDLIVANLPFSSRANFSAALADYSFSDLQSRIRYERMFCAEQDLLPQLILGASFFLRPKGRLVFPIGASSDLNEVLKAVSMSGLKWDSKPGPIIEICGEEIAILDLEKVEN